MDVGVAYTEVRLIHVMYILVISPDLPSIIIGQKTWTSIWFTVSDPRGRRIVYTSAQNLSRCVFVCVLPNCASAFR